MIRCHNLVDVFFAAKTLRNYKPNMVETLVRSPVPLARPLPTSWSTPYQAPLGYPLPYLGPTVGPWGLVLWCESVTPISPFSLTVGQRGTWLVTPVPLPGSVPLLL